MSVADLIQQYCQDRKTARLQIRSMDRQATFYFKDGKVAHAVSKDRQGEDVVYEVLKWNEGAFDLESNVEPPQTTITHSWSGLLLEGARRLDEDKQDEDFIESDQFLLPEVNQMAQKLDELLKEMGTEINGYVASVIVGMDGIDIAHHASTRLDPEIVSAQLTLLLKLVDTTASKLNAGGLEDIITTTEKDYFLIKFLPGKQFFLGLVADHKTSNLGNMRLMSRVFAERIVKAIPHS